MKTSREIQDDVWKLLRDSDISTILGGRVYKASMRPRDQKEEAAEVIFTAGRTGQVSEGVVTINIFFSDISIDNTGVMVEDITRAEQLEKASAEWVKGLSSREGGYLFWLEDTIYTMKEPDTDQHFVVIHLGYSIYER